MAIRQELAVKPVSCPLCWSQARALGAFPWEPDSNGKPPERQLSYLHLLLDCSHGGMAEAQKAVQAELPRAVSSLLHHLGSLPQRAQAYDPDYFSEPASAAGQLRLSWFSARTGELLQGRALSRADERFLTERLSLVLPFSGALFDRQAQEAMPLSYALGCLFDKCALPHKRQRPLADIWAAGARSWLRRVQDAYSSACSEELVAAFQPGVLRQAGKHGFWPTSHKAADTCGCVQPPLELVVLLGLGCGVRSPSDLDMPLDAEQWEAEEGEGEEEEEEAEAQPAPEPEEEGEA